MIIAAHPTSFAPQSNRVSLTNATAEEFLPPSRSVAPIRANSPYLGLTLTLLFLTAAGVQNAIVLTWINVTGGNLSQPGTIYGLALVFAQQGLVALHCGFSRQHVALRTGLFLATMFVSGDLASRYDGRPEMQGTWMLALLAHGLFVHCGVWHARIIGLRLSLPGETDADEAPWQFTLLRLFAAMTISAALLGVFSYLHVDDEQLLHLLTQAALLGALPLQICFCALMNGRFFTLVKVSFATVCLVTTILTFLMPDGELLPMLWLTLLQSLMIHAAISVVQQAGYRIVERPIKAKTVSSSVKFSEQPFRQMNASAPNLEQIDSLLRLVDREIWLVTSAHRERRSGLTATWISQVSLDRERPVLLAGLSPRNFTTELVEQSGLFAAHLVTPDSVSLAYRLAASSGRAGDKLADVPLISCAAATSVQAANIPIIAACRAWFLCRVFQKLVAGDRVFFWGDVIAAGENSPADPAVSLLTEQTFLQALSPNERQHLKNLRDADVLALRPVADRWRQQHGDARQ